MNGCSISHWTCLFGVFTLSVAGFSPGAHGQNHFDRCSRQTGSNLTIIVTTNAVVTVDGKQLSRGDELAAYTMAGHCAGVVRWEGENAALTVWGDDPLTEGKEGFSVSEQLSYRVWDASEGIEIGSALGTVTVEYDAESPYNGGGTYLPDALMRFTRFEASTLAAPVASMAIRQSGGRRPQHKLAFDASASFDRDGEITGYEWDFGDGQQDYSSSISHVFEDGEYLVKLTVTDSDGLVGLTQKTITVPFTGDTSVSIEAQPNSILEVNLFPNPTAGGLRAEVVTDRQDHVSVAVYDITGREVRSAVSLNLPPGRHTIPLNVVGLPAGPYVCRVTVGSQVSSRIVTLTR